MKKVVFLCLLTLSINAVLIQTITTDNFVLKNAIRIGILFLMVLCMLIAKQRILVVLFLLTNLSIILLLLGHNPDQLSFIFIFVFVQSLFLLKQREVEKYLLLSSVIALSLIFIFLLLGITENIILEYRNRMTFGTNGVPFFYNMVYGTFSLWIVYSRKYFRRFKVLITLISLTATTYFYIMTDLRGGYFAFITLIVLLHLVPLTSRLMLLRIGVALIPVVALVISFWIASLNKSIYANQLLSLRPIFLNNFFNNLTFKEIFLSASVKSSDTINIVDNSYLHLLVGGGLVISLTVGCLFFKAILNLYANKKYIEIAFIISTCLYFNSESIMVRMENMFVIYFWYLLIKYSLTNVNAESEEPKNIQQNESNPSVIKQRRFKKYKIVW